MSTNPGGLSKDQPHVVDDYWEVKNEALIGKSALLGEFVSGSYMALKNSALDRDEFCEASVSTVDGVSTKVTKRWYHKLSNGVLIVGLEIAINDSWSPEKHCFITRTQKYIVSLDATGVITSYCADSLSDNVMTNLDVRIYNVASMIIECANRMSTRTREKVRGAVQP